MDTDTGAGPVHFPTTWGGLLSSLDDSPRARTAAIARLIEMYWKPIFLVLRRFHARSNEDAKDLAQDFFMHVLEHEVVEKFDASRGRFRTFLKAALRNFVSKRDRDAARLKRGGGAKLISIDAMNAFDPPAPAPDPSADLDAAFDREWTVSTFEYALAELQRRLMEDGRERCWRVFDRHENAPGRKEPLPSYERVAAELGITPNQVRDDLRYARDLFRGIVSQRLRDTVVSWRDLDDEVRLVFGR